MRPARWTLVLIAVVAASVWLSFALFEGTFRSFVPVTLTSDRAGLVMDPGAKVRLRGVQVGRVASVSGGEGPVTLELQLDPSQVNTIPANVGAQIRASTLFGAKYVDLIYPDQPSPKHIAAGTMLRSRNVSTEVNTVFQNLMLVLKQIDPEKLSATLTALANGVRGQGELMGKAITATNQVLLAVNPRMDTIQQDWRSVAGFADTYSSAARNILSVLSDASTTGTTVTNQSKALDALLLNTIGLARSGIGLLGPTERNLVDTLNVVRPTTDLLMKYNPEYTCMLLGAKWYVDNGGPALGGNGKSGIIDGTFLFGKDMYRYPDNLPLVAAKGGPGGKPGCGSLPDVSANYPVRQLVMNTGFGTGLDIRPNPGIAHPCWLDLFPVTRAVPQPPSLRQCLPGPAIGPVPPPGGVLYGAPQNLPLPPEGQPPGPQPPKSFPGPSR